jgi:hypothetical protein
MSSWDWNIQPPSVWDGSLDQEPDEPEEDEIDGANIPAEDDAVGEPMTCPF